MNSAKKLFTSSILLGSLVVSCSTTTKEPTLSHSSPVQNAGIVSAQHYQDGDFVDIKAIAPNIQLDMRYATTNNFLGRAVYSDGKCLLRYSAAKRLAKVQQTLEQQGLGLKVFDCWRPLSVQKQMWAIKPDSRYVANPQQGSRHNRGMAVDVTLVDENNQELKMPTDFDDFSQKAHRTYQGGTVESRSNRQLLQKEMVSQGFKPLSTEWWHFDAPSWENFPIQ